MIKIFVITVAVFTLPITSAYIAYVYKSSENISSELYSSTVENIKMKNISLNKEYNALKFRFDELKSKYDNLKSEDSIADQNYYNYSTSSTCQNESLLHNTIDKSIGKLELIFKDPRIMEHKCESYFEKIIRSKRNSGNEIYYSKERMEEILKDALFTYSNLDNRNDSISNIYKVKNNISELYSNARRERWPQQYLSERLQEQFKDLQQFKKETELGSQNYSLELYRNNIPNRLMVTKVSRNSIASMAGIEVGDVLISYGGDDIFDWADISENIIERTEFVFDKDSKLKKIYLGKGLLGVTLEEIVYRPSEAE